MVGFVGFFYVYVLLLVIWKRPCSSGKLRQNHFTALSLSLPLFLSFSLSSLKISSWCFVTKFTSLCLKGFYLCSFSHLHESDFWKIFAKKGHPSLQFFMWSEMEWLEQIHVFPETDTTSPISLFSTAFSILKIYASPALKHFFERR